MMFLGNGALKKSDIYVQVFTFMHSNLGAKMVGCGAIFPLGHQFQQSLNCVCSGTRTFLKCTRGSTPIFASCFANGILSIETKRWKASNEDRQCNRLFVFKWETTHAQTRRFPQMSSWTGEVKPVVLKLGPHYMSNDRFCWGNVIPPIFYQNIKKIHSKHLRPRVAFLLTSKMMGHVFSHHFQELAIWWGAKPPFSIVGAIKNQLFF